jgi:outer membrane receptor protein involved in Fe transport
MGVVLGFAATAGAQQAGSLRGVVYDKQFGTALGGGRVTILETGQKATTAEEGNYVFGQVPPGQYTLVFSKQGFTRQVRGDVVVSPGQMTEVNAWMTGDFTEMDEFVVQDFTFEAGTELQILEVRRKSPAFVSGISQKLISAAGASDAADAVKLVAGASVQEGKFAVIRGLPDRYVNSQMNGVRLPTADAEKRAVQLDQFRSTVIESIQVSKTFTPDQQGDASGGAVNVVLKGIPNQSILEFGGSYAFNTQVRESRDKFLTYEGGGVSVWAKEDRPIPAPGEFGGALGVSRGDAPREYDWSFAAGGKRTFETGITLGGYTSLYYKRDVSFFDDGIDDAYWVAEPGGPMVPQSSQGTPIPWDPADPYNPRQDGDFKTKLFDVTRGKEEVQWGNLGTIGMETENHALSLVYLYTRVAEDTATLAEDTRGKEYYFPAFGDIPAYDPDDPMHPGNRERTTAPYLRNQTLKYAERTTETLQLHGRHTLPFPEVGKEGMFVLLPPEVDWLVARSTSGLEEPDKRQFGSLWWGPAFNAGAPPFLPPFIEPAVHRPLKPSANFTLGNIQRIWREIEEESDQHSINVKLPFRQWTDNEGYVKVGLFNDEVIRTYNQDTFSNLRQVGDPFVPTFEAPWDASYSDAYPELLEAQGGHPAVIDGPPFVDVDYRGEQNISAWYWMMDFPLFSLLKVTGGARYESTELTIINDPEENVVWFPPGVVFPVALNPGFFPEGADVAFRQDDVLPSVGFAFSPVEQVTLRGSYSETVARQTFRELSPIQQQEFLGGDIFIGNPFLRMSALKNYDLRLDYEPYEGGLVSVSYFDKHIVDPIETVQRIGNNFTFTTAVNYPEGILRGYEFEVRQELGHFLRPLKGLSVGANATFIDSEVTLPPEDVELFESLQVPILTRDMTNAPEYLYNVYMTYDLEETSTRLAVFYTVRGDTLVAGAGQALNRFVPSVYELEHGTLNVSVSQKLGKHLKLSFKAKNLTDPEIETVYRSDFIAGDVTKTAFHKGIDYSVGLSAHFSW